MSNIRDAYWMLAEAAGVTLWAEDVDAIANWHDLAKLTTNANHRIGAYRAILLKICTDCYIPFSEEEVDRVSRALCLGLECKEVEDPMITLLTQAAAKMSCCY